MIKKNPLKCVWRWWLQQKMSRTKVKRTILNVRIEQRKNTDKFFCWRLTHSRNKSKRKKSSHFVLSNFKTRRETIKRSNKVGHSITSPSFPPGAMPYAFYSTWEELLKLKFILMRWSTLIHFSQGIEISHTLSSFYIHTQHTHTHSLFLPFSTSTHSFSLSYEHTNAIKSILTLSLSKSLCLLVKL